MSIIQAKNIKKEFRGKQLFNSINLSLNIGDKIALIAENGAGKSTLIKILSKVLAPDDGEIVLSSKAKLGYLSQEPTLNFNNTVEQELNSSINTNKDYVEIINNLKITNLNQNLKYCSGGQLKKISIAKLLLESPDILLLDEPTNHLDIEIVDWLANYLKDSSQTILFISHDRYFIDTVCNGIYELYRGDIYKHKGNYSTYLENRYTRFEVENRSIKNDKKIIKKETEYANRAPQGRQSKNGKRIKALNTLTESLKTEHKINTIKIEMNPQQLGYKIMELHNISKSYGEIKILEKFNFVFKRGGKIGMIGSNGVGKSTLLEILTNNVQIDSGNIVIGETLKFGYYKQDQKDLNLDITVIEYIKEVSPFLKLPNGIEISASMLLERFLFDQNSQRKLIKDLSGGEKKRVYLLRILMSNPNFLILDEPTNDFDLLTITILEEFLIGYTGCLIIVSHDKYFMDNIVEQLIVFKGEGVVNTFAGNYTDYRNSNVTKTSQTKEKNDITKKESNSILNSIHKLENKVKTLKKRMFELGDNFEEISKISSKLAETEKEIEDLTQKWIEFESD